MNSKINFKLNDPMRRAAFDRAKSLDMNLSQYMRYLIQKDIQNNKKGVYL